MSEEITRAAAVQKIRLKLLELTEGGKKTVCEVATAKNVFCRGFSRYTDPELKRTFSQVLQKDPHMTREQLEKGAAASQLGQQRAGNWLLTCDMQYARYETCRAWDDFTNAELAHFCEELLSERVEVVGTVDRPLL
jgi:hypothetical protein